MPATVKSLEERIDDLADDFSSVKSQLSLVASMQNLMQAQLATVINGLNTTQAQLAVVVAKLDSTIDELRLTRGRLESIASDYSAFKGKAETTFAMTRWIGIAAFGVLVTVIFSAFSVVRSAAHLETKVDQHEKSLEEVKSELRKQK